jgi:hypothetical protein
MLTINATAPDIDKQLQEVLALALEFSSVGACWVRNDLRLSRTGSHADLFAN